eukprot:gene49640-56745_t
MWHSERRVPSPLPRVCRHAFHLHCLEPALRATGGCCPTCRAGAGTAARVPTPEEDPGQWFALMDVDGEGVLTRVEVLDAVKSLVDADEGALDQLVRRQWARWDRAHRGALGVADLPTLRHLCCALTLSVRWLPTLAAFVAQQRRAATPPTAPLPQPEHAVPPPPRPGNGTIIRAKPPP